ncbi:MAG: VPLPA-CTERM sorting domain-containing protein [Gammaproteobacteria bacterium]
MVLFGVVSTANAALLTRLNGQAVYDTDLDITWLSNANAGAGSTFDDGANATDGRMTWVSANAWAASLNVGGSSGWRLPTTLVDDPSCTGGSVQGQPDGFDCSGSEMGHLFYTELSGIAGNTVSSSMDADLSLFTNIQDSSPATTSYFSSTEYSPDTLSAWRFRFGTGSQFERPKTDELFAWAVHDGDISAVPVPAAVWLFGSGLLGLVGVARRKVS